MVFKHIVRGLEYAAREKTPNRLLHERQRGELFLHVLVRVCKRVILKRRIFFSEEKSCITMEYLDSESIIDEVQKYPYIYDPNHESYKNMNLKRQTWFSITETILEDKWGYMDDNIRRRMGKYYYY